MRGGSHNDDGMLIPVARKLGLLEGTFCLSVLQKGELVSVALREETLRAAPCGSEKPLASLGEDSREVDWTVVVRRDEA